MDFAKLEKNLTDMLMEQQAKLGFIPETVRLYYPLESVGRLLGTGPDLGRVSEALREFTQKLPERFGTVRVTRKGERFCFILPPEMSEAVHAMTGDPAAADFRFIQDFVSVISRHGCTIEDVRALFARYSDHVYARRAEDDDYDYLFYFEDGQPDSYRYCITCEGPHLIYHRYTPEDFAQL